MNDPRSQVYVDPADAIRPPRRGVTVLRLMGYVAASAVAFAFLLPSYATALTVWAGVALFAPIASGWTRFEAGAALGWLSGVVVAVSGVMNLLEVMGFLFGAMLLGLGWLIRLPSQLRADRRVPRLASLLVVPTAGMLGVLALTQTDRVLAVRLATSEAALLRAARPVPADGSWTTWEHPRWIGLFVVERIQRRDGLILWELGSPFMDTMGLAYIPEGQPPGWSNPDWSEFSFRPLRGSWWRYTWHF